MWRKAIFLGIGALAVLILVSALGAACGKGVIKADRLPPNSWAIKPFGPGTCWVEVRNTLSFNINKFGIGFKQPVEIIDAVAVGAHVCKVDGKAAYWQVCLKDGGLRPSGGVLWLVVKPLETFECKDLIRFIFGFEMSDPCADC
jgi:hypothetical protein